MSNLTEELEAGEKYAVLTRLEKEPGFVLLCERFKRDLDAMGTKALDPKTEDAEATQLRHFRAKLLEFEPLTLLNQLRASARSKAQEK